MLHTKFHGNQPAGSGEDVFTIHVYGRHVIHPRRQIVRFPFPNREND